jgi:ketosteroid isomerase-like protein
MKRLKSISFVRAVLCFFLPASMPLCAQEWSSAQKDIWKNVETYTALGVERNVEGFLEYFHNDYCGWDYEDALPVNKVDLRNYLENSDWKMRKILYYDIKPVAIKIHGDIAFVHYYFAMLIKDGEGKEKSVSGRWTDILMKQGNKWFLIGDHGGKTSKN